MAKTIRVREFGASSYWPSTMSDAMNFVQHIRDRNGCGIVEKKGGDGLWSITHRFDRNELVTQS